MSHPYAELEGTRTWAVLDAGLAELEANGDLTITTARSHVIGRLCQRLTAAGVGAGRGAADPPDAEQLVRFLEQAAVAWPHESAWRAQLGTSFREAHVEEARRQAGLTHLRHTQGSISTAQAVAYLGAIARQLRAHAGERGAEDGEAPPVR